MKLRALGVLALAMSTAIACTPADTLNATIQTVLEGETAAVTAFNPGYSNRDLAGTWDADAAVNIQLKDTLTITEAGTYVLSGTLSDGQIIVNVSKDDKVQLVLNGVSLNCSTGAPIHVVQADKVFITLADGTTNTVTDGSSYVLAEGEDEPNAAVYSKEDLTINGTGSLTVNANYKHGINSKDDLVVTGGQITVNAVGDGIRGKDSVAISGGAITINSQGDGIKSNNSSDEGKGWVSIDGGTLNIVTEEGDGIQAETTLQVTDGTLNITTAGGSANAVQSTGAGRGNMGVGMMEMGRGNPGDMGQMDGAPPEWPGGNNNNAQGTPPGDMQPPQDQTLPGSGTPSETPVSGTATATDDSASTKGLKGGTALNIFGGAITIDALDDSLHSNGTAAVMDGNLTLATGDDGIHADEALLVSGGTINITKSYEGLEGYTVTITGGDIHITSSDDGINASSSDDDSSEFEFGGGFGGGPGGSIDENIHIRITGGLIVIDATADGLDSNGNLFIEGGTLLINGPTSGGDGAIDYEGVGEITGGTVIAAGSSQMAMNFTSGSTQPSLLVGYSETQAAGTLLTLTDESGAGIVSFAPTKNYQSVVISSPDLVQGKSYTLYSGGTSQTSSADGLYTGTYTAGTKVVTVTLTDMITSISDTGEAFRGMGMGGGMRGGGSGDNNTDRPQGGGNGFPGGGPGGQKQ